MKAIPLEIRKNLIDLFVCHCVIERKRDRFYFLNHSKKGFLKILYELDHFESNLSCDEAFSLEGFRDCSRIASAFKLNKSEKVFVLSTLRNMKNGVECNLGDALAELFKVGNGSVITCPLQNPRWFFYFGEDVSAQFLWRLEKR